MPLNASIATAYILVFVQGLAIYGGEVCRAIALNDTIAYDIAEGVYYTFGLLQYLSDNLRDMINIISNNSTLMNYSVGMWMNLSKNSTYVFGDENATWGFAYLWRKGYECIQPGAYCESYGPDVTYYVIEFHKWLFSAMSKIGSKFPVVYT